jgi:hypothetical protein
MSRSERSRDLIAILLLCAVIALFFWKLLFTNLILARGDTFLYIYPYWTAAREALCDGRLPLWNPDLFMGAPFLANSQAGVLYPLNWLLWLGFDTPTAASLAIVLHLWLAAGLTYGFARSGLGLHRPPAWTAAVLYALGGYLTAQAEHVNQLQGLAWLPAVFWLLACGKRPTRPLLLGVILAVQVLAGHTQAVFITGVGGLIFAMGRLWRKPGRPADAWSALTHLILGGVLAVLLAAAQLLPTLELTRLSVRGGGLPLSEALSFSLHPLLAGRALLPGVGETIFSEYVAFLPLSALLLALIGAWAGRRRPTVVALALVGAAGLFFAFGAANPIYVLMVKVIPGFGLFRAPARWLILYAFGAAGLAGVGLETLSTRQRLPHRLLVGWTALVLLLIGWALVAPHFTGTFSGPPESPVEAPSRVTLIGWGIEFLLAFLILTRWGGRLAPLLAVLVLLVSSRALPYNHPTAPEAYHALRPAAAQLMAAATLDRAEGRVPPGRFLSMSDIFFDPGDTGELESIYGDQLDRDALYDFIVATKHKEILTPNLPLSFDVPAVDGYDGGVLPLADYVALEGLLLPDDRISLDGRLRENLDAIPEGRWLNLLNIRYLITDKVGDAWSDGVFYDLQHSAVLDHDHPSVQVASIPAFEATGIGIVLERPDSPAGAALVGVTVRFAGGRIERHTLRNGIGSSPLRTEPDGTVLEVAVLEWSIPGTPERISLARYPDPPGDIHLHGLSLVDQRDGTFQSLVVSSQGRYQLIHSGDVKIYENLDVLPRAFLVGQAAWAGGNDSALERMKTRDFDPTLEVVLIGNGTSPSQDLSAASPRQVKINSYRPERVDLTVMAESDGWLVLSDAYYPGWEAEVDGQAVPIERADVLFRAVPLQSGTHHVVFSFRPGSIRNGLLISGISLVLCLLTARLLTVRARSRRWRADQTQPHHSG